MDLSLQCCLQVLYIQNVPSSHLLLLFGAAVVGGTASGSSWRAKRPPTPATHWAWDLRTRHFKMQQDTPVHSLTMHRCSGTAEQSSKNAETLWERLECHGHRLKHHVKLWHSMTPRRQQRLTFALVRQVLSAHIADTPREVPGIAFLTVPARTHTSVDPLNLHVSKAFV